ncbi:MAG: hypothetical protein ACYTBJ_01385 [Planctomycetota bacterium]
MSREVGSDIRAAVRSDGWFVVRDAVWCVVSFDTWNAVMFVVMHGAKMDIGRKVRNAVIE